MSSEELLVTNGVVEGDDAQELLDQIENDPDQFWINLATTYAEQGNYEQALAILQQLE